MICYLVYIYADEHDTTQARRMTSSNILSSLSQQMIMLVLLLLGGGRGAKLARTSSPATEPIKSLTDHSRNH